MKISKVHSRDYKVVGNANYMRSVLARTVMLEVGDVWVKQLQKVVNHIKIAMLI